MAVVVVKAAASKTVIVQQIQGPTGATGSVGPNLIALAVPVWYISFLTGNDLTNSGTALGSPLKTFAGLFAKWGTRSPVLTIPSVTINVIDHDDSDAIVGQFNVEGSTTVVTIQGVTTTVASSGTLSAVTAQNTATNTPPKVKDGTRSWTYGDRIRLTTGTNSGAIAWIGKDETGGVARTTNFVQTIIDPATILTPTVGDQYAIETLTDLYIADINVSGVGFSGQVDVPSTPGVQVVGMRVRSPAATGITTVNGNIGLVLVNSSILGVVGGSFQIAYGSQLVNYGSYIIDTQVCPLTAAFISFAGGAHGTSSTFLITKRSTARLSDFIGQNYAITVAESSEVVCSAPVANFDAVPSTLNPNGDGILVGEGHNGLDGSGGTLSVVSTGALWGSGNAGVGMRICPNSSVVYDSVVPTITGTGGDFLLGGLTTDTTGVFYDSSSLGTSMPITNTWAHLTAAQPTGFNGTAHNPLKNAHIVARSTANQAASIPSITYGTGVPATSPLNGSIFLRTNGTGGTDGVYTRQAGAWSAVGGSTITWATDLAGSTNTSQKVVSLTGSAGVVSMIAPTYTWVSTATPLLNQTTLAGTGATAGQTFSITAQAGQLQTGATANNAGGEVYLTGGAAGTGGSGAAGQPGGVKIIGGSGATLGRFLSLNALGNSGLWLHSNGDAPTASNYTLLANTAATILNVPNSGQVSIAIGNNAVAQWNNSSTDFVRLGGPASGAGSTAAAGLIRLANNLVGAAYRNAANSGDVGVFKVDSGNNLQIGDATNATINMFSGGNVVLQPTANVHLSAGSTFFRDTAVGGISVTMVSASAGASSFTVGSTVTSYTISQAATAVAAATGALLSLTAQGVSGTGTTTSGGLTLSTGTNTGSTIGNVGSMNFLTPQVVGAGTYGEFIFTAGTGNVFKVRKMSGLSGMQIATTSGTYFEIGDGTTNILIPGSGGATVNIQTGQIQMSNSGSWGIYWDYTTQAVTALATSNVTSITHGITASAVAAATGAPFTISAQSATGTGTITGGSMTIAAGDAAGAGAGTGGSLVLRAGDKANSAFSGSIQMRLGSAAGNTMLEANGAFGSGNVLALCVQGALTTTMMPAGTGAAVTYIANRSTAPTANPVGGGVFFVESGFLKYRGTSGTITTLAAA